MCKVITFGIKKGGVGKSCTAYNLAGAIASKGMSVALIDTDTNESVASMVSDRNDLRKELKSKGADADSLPPHIMCIKKGPDETIEDDIEELKRSNDYVIIDTKGTENNAFKEAIVHSDVIYLPTGVSSIDIKELVPTIELIMEQEGHIRQALKRAKVDGANEYKIDARVLFAKVQSTSRDMMREAMGICEDLLPFVSMSSAIVPYIKRVEQNQEHGLTLSDRGTEGFHPKRAVFEMLLDEIDGNRDVQMRRHSNG